MSSLHEEWRPLSGQFAGWHFDISNLGRLRKQVVDSDKRCARGTPGKLIALRPDGRGYMCAHMNCCGRHTFVRMHRLVALAFVPNPLGYEIVNHIDGNKQNNHATNLEWCTVRENASHACALLSRRKALGLPGRKKQIFLKPDKRQEVRNRYESGEDRRALAAEYEVSFDTIDKIVKNKKAKPKKRVFALLGSS